MNTADSHWTLGSLSLPNRLIQGPLAGYSCAAFRELFYQFTPPAYAVSEMISAQDLLHKKEASQRYTYRSPREQRLCYQISGTEPAVMAEAARALVDLGADLIDINCGCPKPKIRKKGAGSALLENPALLLAIAGAVRAAIDCPLTVKIRLTGPIQDRQLATALEGEGIDALIVHGRHWFDDYATASNLRAIAAIKAAISIPVIANGDVADRESMDLAFQATDCDALMISRAGTGRPWLFQNLLQPEALTISSEQRSLLFLQHLQSLAEIENEYQAVLQSKSLFKYYFPEHRASQVWADFCKLSGLAAIQKQLEYLYP